LVHDQLEEPIHERGPGPESVCVPFYDVIFDQPNLNLSYPYLRDLIFNSAWNLPILRERVETYESAHSKA
ncbi:hypothetical protein RBA38_23025, partial [Mycobacteroides abscessus subsp. abscessus]|uniref:hypothetical protein n=1 Tax=Mycobacteroides abscessus TaxID=36809 RepID=UPI003CF7F09E